MCNCSDCTQSPASGRIPSPLSVGPGSRLASLFVFAAALVTVSSRTLLLAALLGIFALGALLRAPKWGARALPWVLPFGAAMAAVLPFATPGPAALRFHLGGWALVATAPGLVKAEVFLLRLVVVSLATGILLGLTSVPQLLDGLRTLRVPAIFVDLVGFIMRYVSVLAGEVKRMTVARQARGLDGGRAPVNPRLIRAYGQMLGVLFERAYERSERLYLAMISRSYPGELRRERPSGFGARDWGWCALAACVSLLLILLDRGLVT